MVAYQSEQNVNARTGPGNFFLEFGSGPKEHSDMAENTLDTKDFTAAEDPFALFQAWLEEAEKSEPADPEAMAVATVDADGLPNVRMILLKGADARGFVFYTNCESAKGTELAATPKAALLFYWKSLGRQVRIRGAIEPVTSAEADAYFATRHRESRIGAWASQQSRPLASRAALEKAVADYTAELDGREVARPDYWRGYRLRPVEIEFWQNGAFRLHDRIVFRRDTPDGAWTKTRLYP
jgi:pyridoxamine 5'-phosphate oxidase